jgi:hypothetical protein
MLLHIENYRIGITMGKTIKHNGSLCLDEECQYKRTCANHLSAGDGRTECGFSPQIWYNVDLFDKNKKELVCESVYFESDNDPYNPKPKECNYGGGFVDEGDIPSQQKIDQIKYLQALGEKK